MPEFIALGEPMAEFAATERGRLSTVSTFRRGWGGDTSNFIVAAARLGAVCGYITRLGADEFGRSFLELWNREGVDTSRVIVEPDGFTAAYFISLDETSGHSFTYYRAGSAASRLQPVDLDADYLGAARIVHTSGITTAISGSARATVDAAIGLARARGLLVSYDANVRPRLLALDTFREIADATMARADIVFLSAEDAGYLYGPLEPSQVMDRVIALGPRLAVLKLGPGGCLVATPEGVRLEAASFPVRAIDGTGAGDAFDAGFLVEWMRGRSLDEAARFANAVGALTTQGLGAVGSIPTRAQVEAFLSQAEPGHRTRQRLLGQARGPSGREIRRPWRKPC